MPVVRGFADENRACYRGGFLSIGNFDGVHRGHQELLAELKQQAEPLGVSAVVLTFDPPPVAILRPESVPPQLSTLSRKVQLLERYGADCVIAYPTEPDLLQLRADEFFQQIIIEQIDARGLVEGPNFFFGKDRSGTIEKLRDLCAESNRKLRVVAPVESQQEQLISSSRIRRSMAEGNVASAIEMMGHAYQVEGVVETGSARGRDLGFPTANLADITTLLPADGVYAGFSFVGPTAYPAAINIGPNPTFGETRRKFEVHLLDLSQPLYGERLSVFFLDRVRETRTFDSPEALVEQVGRDIRTVRDTVAASRVLVDAETRN